MTARFDGICFIDTNVWLYAFILQQDEEKRAVASQLIETLPDIIGSTQVLNEIAMNLLKKDSDGGSGDSKAGPFLLCPLSRCRVR